MREKLNVKIGDKLLYQWGYLYNRVEEIVTVTKVTPTGRIRIDYCDTQFDKYGHEMGNRDRWSCNSSVSIPTEEDYKRIRENDVKSKALSLIGKLNKQNITYEQALKIIEIFEPKECDENEQ